MEIVKSRLERPKAEYEPILSVDREGKIAKKRTRKMNSAFLVNVANNFVLYRLHLFSFSLYATVKLLKKLRGVGKKECTYF